MIEPVILSKLEQEYLLRIIEASVQVRDLHQLFLWSQGQLQALLPHQLMVGMQFGPDGKLQRLEPLHASLIDDITLARLCHPQTGIAVQLARHCSATAAMPCVADLRDDEPARAVWPFVEQIVACGYDTVLLDGTGPLASGATVFALFGLPMRPDARHAYFLSLLLPHLHLALARLRCATPFLTRSAPGAQSSWNNAATRPLTARETEIMHWLRAGKRNDEIADILGLSALTVKNHLQRIYKALGVRNRTEAVLRCSGEFVLA